MSVTVETKKKREPLDLVAILMLGVPLLVSVAGLAAAVIFLILH